MAAFAVRLSAIRIAVGTPTRMEIPEAMATSATVSIAGRQRPRLTMSARPSATPQAATRRRRQIMKPAAAPITA